MTDIVQTIISALTLLGLGGILGGYITYLLDKKKESRRNPARIPPQTPPAGGKSAEAGRILSPRQIVSPCRVRISSFNHLDFARNSFELCPINTARNRNRILKPKWGRHEVPTQMYSPQKILNLKGFATLRVAQKVRFDL